MNQHDIVDAAANMAGIGAIQNNLTATPQAKAVAADAVKQIIEKGNFRPHEWKAMHLIAKNPNTLEANEHAKYKAGELAFVKRVRFIRKKLAATGNTKLLGSDSDAPTTEQAGINNIASSMLSASLAVSHLKLQHAVDTGTDAGVIGGQSFENIGNTVAAGLLNGKLKIQQAGGKLYEFQIRDFFAKNSQTTGVSFESKAVEISPFILVKGVEINVEVVLPSGVTLANHNFLSVDFVGSEFADR